MTSWTPNQQQHPLPEDLLKRITTEPHNNIRHLHPRPARTLTNELRDFLIVFLVTVLLTLGLLLLAAWRES